MPWRPLAWSPIAMTRPYVMTHNPRMIGIIAVPWSSRPLSRLLTGSSMRCLSVDEQAANDLHDARHTNEDHRNREKISAQYLLIHGCASMSHTPSALTAHGSSEIGMSTKTLHQNSAPGAEI